MSNLSLQLYCPLNEEVSEIRLLEILPAPFSSPLNCNLKVASITKSSQPEYQALSYVWGDALDVTNITVNDVVVQITRSLATALQHIRDEYAVVTVWADAICINQEDFEERNEQVSKMTLIYRSAKEVVAWLGEEAPGNDVARAWIDKWALWCTEHSEEEPEDPATAHAQTITSGYDSEAHEALIRLGEQSLWTRIWVLQELVLGCQTQNLTVRWGQERYSFKHLELAVEGWMAALRQSAGKEYPPVMQIHFSQLFATPMPAMLGLVKMFEEPETGQTTVTKDFSLSLLQATSGLKATDPLDKVYGIMGIAKLQLPDGESFTPDYTKSVTHVYVEVSRAIILHSKSLKLLVCSAKWKDDQDKMLLPSWVADLRIRVSTKCFEAISQGDPKQFTEAEFNESVRFSTDHRTLHLTGRIVDQIEAVYPKSFSFRDKGNEFWAAMTRHRTSNGKAPLHTLLQFFGLYSFGLTPEDLSWLESLTDPTIPKFLSVVNLMYPVPAEVTAAGSTEEFLARHFLGIEENEDLVRDLTRLITDLESRKSEINVAVMCTAIMEGIDGRMVFLTSQGELGIGPVLSMAGDVIFYTHLHPFPFVLRREAQNCYRVVGECVFPGSRVISADNSEPFEEIEVC